MMDHGQAISAAEAVVDGQVGRRRVFKMSVLCLMVLFLVGALVQVPAFRLVDLRVFDYLSTFGHPPLPEKGPVIVAIDEPSMADINSQWPWPRSLHAKLVAELRAAGARAIGLDIIFAEPSNPTDDAALAQAMGPDVVLAADESLIRTPQADQLIRTEPLAELTKTGARAGIASIAIDKDSILRAVPAYPDGFAARLAEAAGLPARRDPGLLQWFGPARTYPTVSYYQALDPEGMLPPGFFKDRVVLVGLSLQNAPGFKDNAHDAFATPFTVLSGQLHAGVEVQATIYDNLRTGMAITTAGPALVLMVMAGAVALGALSGWRKLAWMTGLYALAALVGLIAASYFSLRYGRLFVSPAGPALAYLLVLAGQTAIDYAEERRNRRQIIRAFSQYLSPDLVRRLARDPSQLRLGGERRILSVLFCDVRGFTTIAEELQDDPDQLTHLINRLLTPLSEIVLAHGGTIDKYIGDCLMAFWNAPLADADHASHAVAAGLDMLDAVETLNRQLAAEAAATGGPARAFRIGIGINTGACVVGNIGSRLRFDYSALGDSVNLAARLEGESKTYGVGLLIGEQTAAALPPAYRPIELDRIRVKGRTATSPVFTVLRSVSAAELAAHGEFLAAHYAGAAPAGERVFPIAELVAYYRRLGERAATRAADPAGV